jgi:hypothetical protein
MESRPVPDLISKALLEESSLPERMEIYERTIGRKKKLQDEKAKKKNEHQLKRSFESKSVPNFKRLQKQFEAQLQKVKETKSSTVPNEFRFSPIKPKSTKNGT